MPMIDVYAPDDLFPAGSDRAIGEQLTKAVLRAEGVSQPTPFHFLPFGQYRCFRAFAARQPDPDRID